MSQSTIVKNAPNVNELDNSVLLENGVVFVQGGKLRTDPDTFGYFIDQESSSGSQDDYAYLRLRDVAIVGTQIGIDQYNYIIEPLYKGENGFKVRLRKPAALNLSEIDFTTTILSGAINIPTIGFNDNNSFLAGIGLIRGGIYLKGYGTGGASLTFFPGNSDTASFVIAYLHASGILEFQDSNAGFRIPQNTSAKLGFWGATPVARTTGYTQTYATASRTHAAYTADAENVAYTGIDNAQAGTVYATVADLNALRVAYENLRAAVESAKNVLNQVIDDMQTYGILG